MNREQAGHLLDAYEKMARSYDADAANALREVILDAMTEYRANTPKPGITYPFATWVDNSKIPTNWDGTPKVTCSGIDPAYNAKTGVGV